MLSFLAMMIIAGLLLWLIITIVVFIGGFIYYFFKDVSKEVAVAKAKSNIKPLTINKKPFFKLVAVLGASLFLFYISDRATDSYVILASIVGLLALSCYCFYQFYESLQQNKKLS